MAEYNALSIGSVVGGRYTIRQVLGQGGIGRTYLVADTQKFDAPMTLKEFAPTTGEPKTDAWLKAQHLFKREARILNDLDHPQIPKFHGFFEEGGRLFLVQDYINGRNYREILQEKGTLTESEALDFLQSVLGVLDYVHRDRKTIHRDISPENVMQQEGSGTIYLIDFGIGKQLKDSLEMSTASSYQPSLVGKPSYCPPEQMGRGMCSESSDLYALAVTTIELLSGHPHRDPQSWQQSLPQPIAPGFAATLTKMLAYNIDDRYPSAHVVLAALQQASDPQSDLLTLIEPDPSKESQPPLQTIISRKPQPNPLTPTQPDRKGWTQHLGVWGIPIAALSILGLLGLWGLQQLTPEKSDIPSDPLPSPSPSSGSLPSPPVIPQPPTSPPPSTLPTPPSFGKLTPPPILPSPTPPPLPPEL
ncbi:MAG: serine/threonine-protein kinase [Prochlorothrix sp.]|nr:serine/threonine-protein kinase [Prochlorothrix sp.]